MLSQEYSPLLCLFFHPCGIGPTHSWTGDDDAASLNAKNVRNVGSAWTSIRPVHLPLCCLGNTLRHVLLIWIYRDLLICSRRMCANLWHILLREETEVFIIYLHVSLPCMGRPRVLITGCCLCHGLDRL